jgi:hypothetical protein
VGLRPTLCVLQKIGQNTKTFGRHVRRQPFASPLPHTVRARQDDYAGRPRPAGYFGNAFLWMGDQTGRLIVERDVVVVDHWLIPSCG